MYFIAEENRKNVTMVRWFCQIIHNNQYGPSPAVQDTHDLLRITLDILRNTGAFYQENRSLENKTISIFIGALW